MEEEKLRKKIAENLCYYRKLARLTQSELAEKLNYSDKSVSKWERGEGVPDVYNLCQIAELYHISVNDLISDKKKKRLPLVPSSKLFVMLLSIGLLWLVSVLTYTILRIFLPEEEGLFLTFIYSIPVSGIIGVVFSGVWKKRVFCGIFSSIILWGTILSITLSFSQIQHIWLFYIVGGVLQLLVIIWFFFRNFVEKIYKK